MRIRCNDCQENWHNNNNFFVFLRAIYSEDEAGLVATLTLITNYSIKNINEKAIITTHCHGSCVAADGSAC